MLKQHILVNKSGTHEDMVYAVASASGLRYVSDSKWDVGQANWKAFLDGQFTKTVRAAPTLSAFETATANESSIVYVKKAIACALTPCEMDDLSESVLKFRVSELEMPREGWLTKPTIENSYFTVAINPDAPMSTGKTASQVAHSVLAWTVRHGFPDKFVVTDRPEYFKALKDDSQAIRIVDNGQTEIEPNTLTTIIGFTPLIFG